MRCSWIYLHSEAVLIILCILILLYQFAWWFYWQWCFVYRTWEHRFGRALYFFVFFFVHAWTIFKPRWNPSCEAYAQVKTYPINTELCRHVQMHGIASAKYVLDLLIRDCLLAQGKSTFDLTYWSCLISTFFLQICLLRWTKCDTKP